MDNPGDLMHLCRLCLVKDQVNIPIFEEHGDIRQIFVKISSCLPVKVSKDDQLPKRICDGCSNKLDLLYEFCNTSANSEKKLLSWLEQAGLKDVDTISAVAQHTAKPLETQTQVKQEALEDIHAAVQQTDHLELTDEGVGAAVFEENAIDESDEPPPPKRARRTAAVKAQINITPDSDDDDDDMDISEPMTKVEDESDDSDVDKDPSYVDVPGTSADDQPGPSGVGKDGVEAPDVSDKLKDGWDDISTKADNLERDENGVPIIKTPAGYQCQYCDRVFQQRCKLKNHFIVHSSDRPWKCDVCDKTFKHKRVLDYHIKTVHGESENFPCDVCGKIFGNKRNCIVHRKRHGKEYNIKCEICGKAFLSNFYLKKHSIVHSDERPLRCSYCDKTFKHQRVLSYHVKTLHMNTNEQITCDICGKLFSTKRNCAVHRKRHLKEYTIFCEFCGKGFLNNFYLQKHLNSKHYGKRHICDVCGASIGDKGNLRNHMKLHDPNYKKPPPEKCQLCNKAFSDLKRHYKAAHENDGKNYKCEYCGKFFRGKDGLKFHLMIHRGEKPFQCQFCDKSFILNTFLRQHLRTHPESDVKPFQCSYCEKTFIKKSLLDHHVNVHTGQRPFECEFCRKTFTGRKYLTAHVSSQHSAERY